MVMVAEQPGVDIAIAQGFLDGVEVHGQTVILHDGKGRSQRTGHRSQVLGLGLRTEN